jgi:ABC-2 type transport system permease protein
MNWRRAVLIARTDLRMLWQSPDFWGPMVLIALFFFVFAPAVLLLSITRIGGEVEIVQQVSAVIDVLPEAARARVESRALTPEAQTSYALAVYLFAPLAVIVPMMISTAVGANTIVGEREKGTGEFLAHSPATEREIFVGKLIASLTPGYITTLVGFAIYALLVNTIVGPDVGGWFFPTGEWWVLMLWVVPPFLCLTLSVVLRLSARVKSAAAAQQASGLVTLPLILLSYAQSTGALFGVRNSGWVLGLLAWVAAAFGLARGSRAVTRARLLGIDAA